MTGMAPDGDPGIHFVWRKRDWFKFLAAKKAGAARGPPALIETLRRDQNEQVPLCSRPSFSTSASPKVGTWLLMITV